MEIILSNSSETVFARLINEIDDWQFVIASSEFSAPDDYIFFDHWLGSSRDGSVWALAVRSNADDGRTKEGAFQKADPLEQVVALLLDPPKRDADTIAEILLRIHYSDEKINDLDAAVIDEIVRLLPFPEHQKVGSFLPQAPKEWLDYPAELLVGIDLSEGISVSKNTVEEFARDSLDAAIDVVFGPRKWGILIGYTLAVCEVIPFLSWNVDWPLARRGKEEPWRREKKQGILPWEYEADNSLLSIYQCLPCSGTALAPHVSDEPVVRLRVGGRNRDEAVSNWHTCARALRKLKLQGIQCGAHQ